MTQHLFRYTDDFTRDVIGIRKLLVYRENLGVWLDKKSHKDYYEKISMRPTDAGERAKSGGPLNVWGFPVYLSESLPENTFVIEAITGKFNE